jgi:hypothetical protein
LVYISFFDFIFAFLISVSNIKDDFNSLVDLRSITLTPLLASCYRYPIKNKDINSFIGLYLLLSLHRCLFHINIHHQRRFKFIGWFYIYYFHFIINFLLSISNERWGLKFIYWFISITLTSLWDSCYRYPMKGKDLNSFIGLYLLLSLHY